ncbi:MAG: hypothetical protein K8W52_17370 [Deltaproteobacteria bacterium]|nr:hypothetical protein [Deltaproteobacteria bacterium]
MRARLTTSIACLVTSLIATVARADAPSAIVEAAAPDAAASDPGAGQLVVSSTALTRPAGSLTLASHMGLTGVVYGVNDRVEVGGYILPTFLVTRPEGVSAAITAKLALVNRGPVRVALETRAGTLEQSWWYAEASAIATACVDRACATLVNAEATVGRRLVTGSTDDSSGGRYLESRLAVGAQVRIADHVKLVADVAWARETYTAGPAADALLLAPGVRVHGRAWMVQAAAAIDALSGDALPWISAAYRF